MISHDFKTVFVHIPKTGGQSVEHAFLQAHGLTWDTREGLLLRPNEDRSQGPQRLAHLYAREYVELGHVSREQYADYFSFAVVRHPHARLLSEYNARYPYRQKSFGAFLDDVTDDDFVDRNRHMRPQARFLQDADGETIIDEIVRFEDLSTRLPVLLTERIGRPATLPHVNRSRPIFRRKRIPARHLDRVNDMYREDFELLGYPADAR